MQKKTYQTQFSMEVVVKRNFQRGQHDFGPWAYSVSLPSLVPWMSFTSIPMDSTNGCSDLKSKLMFKRQDKRCVFFYLNSMYLLRYLLHPEHSGCCRRRCCCPYFIQILAAKCPENHASSHRAPSEALLAPEPFAQSAQKGAVLVAAEAGLTAGWKDFRKTWQLAGTIQPYRKWVEVRNA